MHVDPFQMLRQLYALVERHIDRFGEHLQVEVGVHGAFGRNMAASGVPMVHTIVHRVAVIVVLPQHLVKPAPLLGVHTDSHVPFLVHGHISIGIIVVAGSFPISATVSEAADGRLLPVSFLVLVFGVGVAAVVFLAELAVDLLLRLRFLSLMVRSATRVPRASSMPASRPLPSGALPLLDPLRLR